MQKRIEKTSPNKSIVRRKSPRLVSSPSRYSTVKTKRRRKLRGKRKLGKKTTSLSGEEGGATATSSTVKKEAEDSNINAIILQNIKTIMSTQTILLKKIANIEADIKNMKLKSLEK